MMIKLTMKLFILLLICFFYILEVDSAKMKMKKEESMDKINAAMGSLSREEQEKMLSGLDDETLQKMLKESEADNKSEEAAGLTLDTPNASKASAPKSDEEILGAVSSGDIDKLNLDDIKSLAEEDKTYEGQSCDQIKQMGQQRDYCEKKYLLAEGEEKTVECMKSFCFTCCGGDDSCEEKCSKTHAMFADHDPEEMFIKVCAYQNMGPSFDGFCKSMLSENDNKEFDNCVTNFCFDCCSNELKVNDFNDPEMMKCLGICRPPNNKPSEEAVPGTPEANAAEANKIKVEIDAADESKPKSQVDSAKNKQITDEEKKINEDFLDMLKKEDEINNNNPTVKNSPNEDALINNNLNENKDTVNGDVKVLVDFSKKGAKQSTPDPKSKAEVKLPKDDKKFIEEENKNIIHTPIKVDDKTKKISEKMDKPEQKKIHQKQIDNIKDVEKKFSNVIKEITKEKNREKEEENKNLDSIRYTPEERKKGILLY